MSKYIVDDRLNFVLQPCCATWCREWQETQGGKYPASNHAPGCQNFKPVKFVRLKMPDGPVLICEPGEVAAICQENVLAEWDDARPEVIGEVMLTEDQYERLKEYDP